MRGRSCPDPVGRVSARSPPARYSSSRATRPHGGACPKCTSTIRAATRRRHWRAVRPNSQLTALSVCMVPSLLCRPCSSASTGRWLTPAHRRDLAMTTSANRGLRLLAAGHAIYVGTHTSRAAYHRRVNTGRHPPPRLPLVPLGAANRSFESFELFSLPGAACRNRTDDLFITSEPLCRLS